MKWSNEDRHGLLRTLDGIDRVMSTFLKVFLGLIILAIVAVVVLVIMWEPWGAGSQGEWFYFSVAVLLALGWVMGQYEMLRRRQRERCADVTVNSSAGQRSWTWTFRLGSGEPNAQNSVHENSP